MELHWGITIISFLMHENVSYSTTMLRSSMPDALANNLTVQECPYLCLRSSYPDLHRALWYPLKLPSRSLASSVHKAPCGTGLIPSLRLCCKWWNAAEEGPRWKEPGPGGKPWKWTLGPWLLPFPAAKVDQTSTTCCHHADCAQSKRAQWPQAETCVTVSQNKPCLLLLMCDTGAWTTPGRHSTHSQPQPFY